MRSTKAKAETPAPFELPQIPTLEGEDWEKARLVLEDKIVRSVREQGYCSQAIPVMKSVLGDPRPGVFVWDFDGYYGASGTLAAAYVDSDGKDCWNNEWRDYDGFGRDGLDRNGRDKDGYDKDGYDKAGFNREGFDKDGLAKDDPSRFKYSSDGYDKDGFNAFGRDRWGYDREGKNSRGRELGYERFSFDKDGYDAEGYNRDGYNRKGEYNGNAANKYYARR